MAPPFIHNTSPIAMLATFTVVLRNRFSPVNKTKPWVWTGDPNTSTVYIYSEYDRASEGSDLSPKVVVKRGPIGNKRVTIGDSDQSQPAHLRRGAKYFLQHSTAGISIECIGESKGEADHLADMVQAAIQGAEEIICKTFALLQISPLLIQPIRPYDTDKKKWLVEIDFRVDLERRWFTLPNSVPIRQINADVTLTDQVGALVTTYLESPS